MSDNRTLIVFYSLEGNTRMIAETIAAATGGELLELQTEKPIANDASKYVWGGKQVVMKQKPKLLPYDFDQEKYDLIFIGTPVWAWNYAPAIRTFLAENQIKGKKIAMFSCNGGDNGKTFENFKKALPGNEFVGELSFFEPLKKSREESAAKAKEWAKEMAAK